MARVAGVDLPPRKRIEIGLTYIYGIGRTRANSILYRAGVDREKKVSELTEDEVNRIRLVLEEEGAVTSTTPTRRRNSTASSATGGHSTRPGPGNGTPDGTMWRHC
jgi:ribosomal protein S13